MIDTNGDPDESPRRRPRSRLALLLVALGACVLLGWFDRDLAVVLAVVLGAGYLLHGLLVWLAQTGLFVHVLVVASAVLCVVWLFLPEAFDPESTLGQHMPGPVRRIEERLGMRSGPAAPPNPDAPNSPDAAEAATPARGPRTVAPLLPPVGSSGSTAQTQAPARAGAEKASARRTETRTELTVTPAPATDQNSITLRAVVSALGERVGAGRITGQVTFSAGTGESLGVSPLTTENGIASAALMIKLPPGRHQVTASYSGNSRFAGSASGWLSVTVTKTGRLSVHPSQ